MSQKHHSRIVCAADSMLCSTCLVVGLCAATLGIALGACRMATEGRSFISVAIMAFVGASALALAVYLWRSRPTAVAPQEAHR